MKKLSFFAIFGVVSIVFNRMNKYLYLYTMKKFTEINRKPDTCKLYTNRDLKQKPKSGTIFEFCEAVEDQRTKLFNRKPDTCESNTNRSRLKKPKSGTIFDLGEAVEDQKTNWFNLLGSYNNINCLH